MILSAKEIKDKIVEQLKNSLPDREIKKEISPEEWMTGTELIAVTYDGSTPSENDMPNTVHQKRELRYSVHVRLRDILQNDELLDLFEQIKNSLNGYKIYGNDYITRRLVFAGDEPDDNLAEFGIWSHRVKFLFSQEEFASAGLI